MRDAFDLMVHVAAIFVGFFVAGVGCAMLWCATISPLACDALGEGMGVKTNYLFWHGCFVEMPDGKMLPESVAKAVLEKDYKVTLENR